MSRTHHEHQKNGEVLAQGGMEEGSSFTASRRGSERKPELGGKHTVQQAGVRGGLDRFSGCRGENSERSWLPGEQREAMRPQNEWFKEVILFGKKKHEKKRGKLS